MREFPDRPESSERRGLSERAARSLAAAALVATVGVATVGGGAFVRYLGHRFAPELTQEIPVPKPDEPYTLYAVQPSDNPTSIARRFEGVPRGRLIGEIEAQEIPDSKNGGRVLPLHHQLRLPAGLHDAKTHEIATQHLPPPETAAQTTNSAPPHS